jgi:hypothetical protein
MLIVAENKETTRKNAGRNPDEKQKITASNNTHTAPCIDNILSSQPTRHQQLNYYPSIHPTSKLSGKKSEEKKKKMKSEE